MMKLTSIAVIMALCTQAVFSVTTTFYIDASKGSDSSADGSKPATPYKTLEAAVSRSAGIINSGTFTLITYSFANGSYPITLTGGTTLSFSQSSPIAFVATTASSVVTIEGRGNGVLKFSGGYENYTFTGITFKNLVADALAGASSIQFISPADLVFNSCTFSNWGGASALGDIKVTSGTVNGVPGFATAFKNTDPLKYAITITGTTISNVDGTVVNSFGTIMISTSSFTTVSSIFSQSTTDNANIALNGVNAFSVNTAISIAGVKGVTIQVTNSKFINGGTIISLNNNGTATLKFTGSSVSQYTDTAFFLLGLDKKLIVANFTGSNFTDNNSVAGALIDASYVNLGFKNVVFINNTAYINPNTHTDLISTYSAPVYVNASTVYFSGATFTNNAASANAQSQGTYGGAIICSGSTVGFGSTSFSNNGQSDLLCDGNCTSQDQITDICKVCVRKTDGTCTVPITSSAVTSGKRADFTTGNPTTAALTSGRQITTAAFKPAVTSADAVNSAILKAIPTVLMAAVLLLA